MQQDHALNMNGISAQEAEPFVRSKLADLYQTFLFSSLEPLKVVGNIITAEFATAAKETVVITITVLEEECRFDCTAPGTVNQTMLGKIISELKSVFA